MASSVWKGHITFGLVSLPVKLTVAARGETISFNQLHTTDNSRVKQVIFCQAEDKPIPRNEIVKGFEYEKDHYVVIEDEEIKKMAPKTAKVMEILEFVKARQIAGLTLTEVRADHGIATVRGSAATAFAKRVCWECVRRVTGVRYVVDLVELTA